LKGIGAARSEQADVSSLNDLVKLPKRVPSGTQLDDGLASVLKFKDMFLSAVCKFCEGKLR
jgi:hypothetical protein